jgi:hypothetical protein
MSTKKEEYESTLKMKFKRKRMFSEFILGNKEGDVDMRNKTTKKYKNVLVDGNGIFKTEKKEYKFKALQNADYANGQYALDMSREKLYAETDRRLK